MQIIEMFKSIQGEGQHIGMPSIFVRLADCNLNCEFCDTKYSWKEKGKYEIKDAIQYIRDRPKYNHLVFTGGESLLKDNQQIIRAILQNTLMPDSMITIETNGTILPEKILLAMMNFSGLWSISPKLQFMDLYWDTQYDILRMDGVNYSLEILKTFDKYYNRQWKFVITNVDEDMKKIIKLLEEKVITATPKKPIIIQPNGQAINYHTACRELAEYVIENDLTEFKVLLQFHKICWGNQRGI